MPCLRLAAGSALLALVALPTLAGCGSQSPAPDASKKSSDSPSSGSPSTTSGAATPTAAPTTQTEIAVQNLRDRVQKSGTGTFSMVTSTIAGKVQASVNGRYALGDQQLAAKLRVPQSSGKVATARVEQVKADAFFQTAQWKQPARSCWLRTSSQQLSQDYGLDVASTDAVPLPVELLNGFQPVRSSGKGLIDGNLDITSVLPLLSGSVKSQLVADQPKGVVPAFLTFSGNDVLVTVPGYALSAALARSLGVAESKFASIAAVRYEAGVTVTGSVAGVKAPGGNTQMSAADLKANRCG